MDLDKLNAYNLSAQEVEQAIQTENIETPGGRVVRGPNETGRSNAGPRGAGRGIRQHHRQERRRRADPDSRCRPRGRRHGGEAHASPITSASRPSCSMSGARPARTPSRLSTTSPRSSTIDQQDAAARREDRCRQRTGYLHQSVGFALSKSTCCLAAYWPRLSFGFSFATGAWC